MNIDKEALEKAAEKAARDIIERDKLTSKINYEVLDRVLQDLKDKEDGSIDACDISYFPEKFNFSSEEYSILFESLEKYAGGISDKNGKYKKEVDHTSEFFPDARFYFEYKGYKFIWRLLIGQGSACQLFDLKNESEDWPSKEYPMKWDESRKITIEEKEYAANKEN